MSSWFESNPTKSVIVHTVLVVVAVWEFPIFVLDVNKVNFYEAKVSRIEAESREVSARNKVLSTWLEYLTQENNRMKKWLEGIPKSIPHYEKQTEELQSEIKSLKENITNTSSRNLPQSGPQLYKNSYWQDAATSIVDNETKVVPGVAKINYGDSADINLTLPNDEKIKAKSVAPGENWTFSKGESNYMLVIESIDWQRGSTGLAL
jgi:hypothetical protein